MKRRLCRCGCGQVTNVCKVERKDRGIRKGEHYFYIRGHTAQGKTGRNSPGWRRGWTINNKGYILRFVPDHPNAPKNGYMMDHILIAEKVMGKVLPPGAEMHHVDENPSNNRNNNLVICESKKYHAILHSRMRAFKACGHAHWRVCNHCKKWDDPRNMYTTYKTAHHRECENKYNRERYHRV